MLSQTIKEDLTNYTGEYNSFIDITPYIYKRLEEELHKCNTLYDKHIVCSALGFGASPLPIMPKEIYGPFHYIPYIVVGGLSLLALGINKIDDNFDLMEGIASAIEILEDDEYKQLRDFIHEEVQDRRI